MRTVNEMIVMARSLSYARKDLLWLEGFVTAQPVGSGEAIKRIQDIRNQLNLLSAEIEKESNGKSQTEA